MILGIVGGSPDCRPVSAGGTGWSSTTTTEYQGSCAARESRVRTDYTKAGCEPYSTYSSWASNPDCGTVGGACWTWWQPSDGYYQINSQWFYLYSGIAAPLDGNGGSAVALQSGNPCNVPTCNEEYKIYYCGATYSWIFQGCNCY